MANIEKKLLGCQACSPEQKFQLSSANTIQTIGELSAQYWGELWPDSPTYARLIICQWHLPGEDLLTEAQHCILHWVLVLICSSNVGREIVPSWFRNSGPVTHLQDGHQGNTSCQGCRRSNPPERAWRHMCLSNTKNFPYPRRNGFSTDRQMLPIVTQKKRSYTSSIWLCPKWFGMS